MQCFNLSHISIILEGIKGANIHNVWVIIITNIIQKDSSLSIKYIFLINGPSINCYWTMYRRHLHIFFQISNNKFAAFQNTDTYDSHCLCLIPLQNIWRWIKCCLVSNVDVPLVCSLNHVGFKIISLWYQNIFIQSICWQGQTNKWYILSDSLNTTSSVICCREQTGSLHMRWLKNYPRRLNWYTM